MDKSKVCGCFPQILLMKKLETCELGTSCLTFIMVYLTLRKQPNKKEQSKIGTFSNNLIKFFRETPQG